MTTRLATASFGVSGAAVDGRPKGRPEGALWARLGEAARVFCGRGTLRSSLAATEQPPMEDDIRALLEARKYREAFERLLDRLKDKVFRLAFSYLRDETQAEDLTQEVFLRVWKGLPGYTGQASPSTWVYTITRNTCLTELKRRSARPTVSLSAPEIEEGLDSITALQVTDPEGGRDLDVRAILARLPDNYRRVITLFYLEQKAYEEVATLLGIPLGTVKTLLFRARKEMLRLARLRPPFIPQT